MNIIRFNIIFLAAAILYGASEIAWAQPTPTAFTGSFAQNFDAALSNGSTTMPPGFRSLYIPGNNTTFIASVPISTAGVASAVPSSSQSLLIWNFGQAVTDSAGPLFNIGNFGYAGNCALGTDPSGIAADIIELSLANATGSNLFGVTVNYNCLCLTNGSVGTEQGELPGYSFFFSVTGGTNAGDWTRVDGLSIGNYTEGTSSNSGNVNITFPAPLPNNGVVFFRWADDNNEANSPDQMLAIDDVFVSAYQPPVFSATLTSPPANASYLAPATIPLSVMVTDFAGTVTNVMFYNGTNFLTNAAAPSFSNNWLNVPVGNYAVSAVAYDNQGLSATSIVANISVIAPHIPPTVILASPTNGSAFNASVNLILTANASANTGSITNVAFYQNAIFIGNVTNAPFSLVWSNVPPGGYALSAIATDDSGASSTSGVINISTGNLLAVKTMQQIKTIFLIALENHDWVQSSPQSSPQQLMGNPAAPYLNSLSTPGNSNAVQTAFASHYYSVAYGEHPSEPNYIWAEAGTDFGTHTSADPSSDTGNLFSNVMHLSGQLTAAGIPWRSYQEDVEYSFSSAFSAAGTAPVINPYNGTYEYYYAVKHNPMAFFADTLGLFCYPMTNFWKDLTNNNIGRYNWITPNQYNEMHSSLPGGYTYHNVAFTGDQAAIAEGDNALSIIVPKIMASAAYKDHGVIIIRMDETESTDDTSTTLPFVIVSPLAKGNAFNSQLNYNHSSVLKAMDELFGLTLQTNAIPFPNVSATGQGYNCVNGSSLFINDLSDFFVPAGPVITVPNPIFITTTNLAGINVTFSVTAADSIDGTLTPNVSPSSGSVFPLGTNIVMATATDSAGLSATNTFQIVVQNVNVSSPLILNNTVTERGNNFQFSFVGATNQTYRVIGTSNLSQPVASWTVFASGSILSNPVTFTNLGMTNAFFFYSIISP